MAVSLPFQCPENFQQMVPGLMFCVGKHRSTSIRYRSTHPTPEHPNSRNGDEIPLRSKIVFVEG